MTQPAGTPPGDGPRPDWYPDPTGRYEYRWFNGVSWTADVSRDGVRSVDPLPTAIPAGSTAAAAAPRRGTATAALVLGIVAIALSWMPFLVAVGAVCAVLAIVLGVVARRATPRDPRGFAGVGIVLGAAAVVVCALGVFLTVRVVDEIDAFTDPPDHDVEISRCDRDGGMVTVAGRLTNLDDEASEFLVFVRVRAGGEARAVVVDVGHVGAGATESFTRDVRVGNTRGDAGAEATCRITHVTGPYPFGIALAP